MSTCVCDGSEDYDCPSILDNMDRLCYHKIRPTAEHSGEGGGQGVEEQNENNNKNNRNHHQQQPNHHQNQNQQQNGRTTAGNHSGHHPDQHHHPHHTQKRPHLPHDPIESNEVEIRDHRPPQYPTSRRPTSRASTTSTSSFGLFFLFAIVIHRLSNW